MNIIDREVQIKSESDRIKIYPIGDVHLGSSNCAERHFREYVDYIAKQPNALWVGGGDYCNLVTPVDVKRFDPTCLADWIYEGKADTIKTRLMDISKQERERFCEIVEPIRDKCVGLIKGNHEHSIMHHCNNNHHYIMCEELEVPNLTDCAGIRFRSVLTKKGTKSSGSSVTMLILHGMGGGRTAGAEPNHLARIVAWADFDIIIRGHSHIFDIEPAVPKLYIPKKGTLPDELMSKEVRSGNWGCWLKSYKKGFDTYDSRANYPPRPFECAMEIEIKPIHGLHTHVMGRRVKRYISKISMRECDYEAN